MPELNVFVFGAGASKGWSLDPQGAPPVTRDFFMSARESIRLRSAGFNSRWPCFGHLKTIYGLPKKLTPLRLLQEGHFDDLNLEDAATRLFQRSSQSEVGLKAYYNFKLLITSTIGKALRNLGRKRCSFHDQIVDQHINSSDTVVSFNYDWILERSLKHAWPDWGKPEDYCFPGHQGTWRKRKRPRLLKPHGSIDWQVSNCKVSLGHRGKILNSILKRKIQPEEVAIVPPVLAKDAEARTQGTYFRSHFKEIWRRTEETFSKARRIIFLGYSLPRGDSRAYQTILTAARQRKCG